MAIYKFYGSGVLSNNFSSLVSNFTGLNTPVQYSSLIYAVPTGKIAKVNIIGTQIFKHWYTGVELKGTSSYGLGILSVSLYDRLTVGSASQPNNTHLENYFSSLVGITNTTFSGVGYGSIQYQVTMPYRSSDTSRIGDELNYSGVSIRSFGGGNLWSALSGSVIPAGGYKNTFYLSAGESIALSLGIINRVGYDYTSSVSANLSNYAAVFHAYQIVVFEESAQ